MALQDSMGLRDAGNQLDSILVTHNRLALELLKQLRVHSLDQSLESIDLDQRVINLDSAGRIGPDVSSATIVATGYGNQVLAYSDNILRSQDVLAIYGLASTEEKVDLILSIKSGDVSRVVKKSEAYLAGGIDIRRLVLELITLLKDLLIFLINIMFLIGFLMVYLLFI